MTEQVESSNKVGVEGPGNTAEYELIKLQVLRDLRASGGLAEGRLSQEILFLLPRDFIDAYVRLFWEALAEVGGGGEGKGAGEANLLAPGVSSERRGHGGRDGYGTLQAQGGGKKYKNTWLLKDERALRVKKRIDEGLSALSQEIEMELADASKRRQLGREGKGKGKGKGKAGVGSEVDRAVRCKGMGCGRFNSARSNYCSNCGKEMG